METKNDFVENSQELKDHPGSSGDASTVSSMAHDVTASHPPSATDHPNNSNTTPRPTSTANSSQLNDTDERFVCNICLDQVTDSVVTLCGHLYCWPCLFRWLNIGNTTCPVCKAGVSRENVIPLFIRGCEEDPRLKTNSEVPNRPNAQRPTPGPSFTPGQQPGLNGQFNGMAFGAGIGFFPSLFGLQFQTFVPPPQPHHVQGRALTQEEIQQNFVSRFLIMLGTFVILCLLFF